MLKFLKLASLPGTITGVLIVLFLSGKIIEIPRGTAEGGVISGVGVLVIMVSVVASHVGISVLVKKYKKIRKQQ